MKKIFFVALVALMGGAAVGSYSTYRYLVGEWAFSKFTDDLSSLAYMESARPELANSHLRRQIEVSIATIVREDSSLFRSWDAAALDKWLKRYGYIRLKYDPIDHEYAPSIREIVDEAIESVGVLSSPAN